MILRIRLIAALLAPVILISAGIKAHAGEGRAHLYAVIFGIVVDRNDQVTKVRVPKVIDPATGTQDAVSVRPADVYVSAAEKFIRTKGYKANLQDGEPVEFFTYFFYDPTQPDRIDIDPKAEE